MRFWSHDRKEHSMKEKRPDPETAQPKADAENGFKPTPDEAGPHDVPDDEVIEGTLPKSATPDES
jgi:hypothetical protein